ncbi:CLUMA_CG010965, isoform A [Clunio marinus]|uniref:CLUMA_CG010965, isoform A n=1 Tax=Clunio marinus TaxID=568069 RepID=A0A1J1IBJ0_9DIPT|nr:CLUMA_CG010965, isoform A [Clunio marinus]
MLEANNVFNKAKLDVEFAEKLRKESPTQFNTLIKMHLSFLLDMNENESEITDKTKHKKIWLFPKKKHPSICTSKCGVLSPDPPLLTQDLIKQLKVLMQFLQKDENLCQEGIFRKTGSVSRQQELKYLVNQLKPLNLDEFTCHDVASVMKSILADLPQPLLTEFFSGVDKTLLNKGKPIITNKCAFSFQTYFPAYSQVAEICNLKENDEQNRIMNSLQLLCLLLPYENRTVLESLIMLLHKASKMESHNKMTADTLATLFTPHLICPRKLPPEVLHQTAAAMTRMISFIISSGSSIFLVPEKLSTDIRAYFVEQKRRRETPEKVLDESISDSVANTVYTFVDREKTAEAHISNPTDTALAQLYAHIQSLPESSKKKKLIKQFNKQNGQGTPLQFVNRDKSSSACRSIGDSIKKHIFHKTLHKTPKRNSTHTPSQSSNIPSTPLAVQISQEEMIDDEDFRSSDEEDCIEGQSSEKVVSGHVDQMEHKELLATTPCKKSTLFKSGLIKGVSLGNLKFPFHSKESSSKTSPKIKKSKSSSILIDIEKDDDKRKQMMMRSGTESFDSEESSDLFFSICEANKEHWHVDVSNINYFLNQTGIQEHPAVRNSMSPITKSTQRMPKSMQESIMTPRSRKPVMLAIFGNSDVKSYQNNISELLEESETELQTTSDTQTQSSGDAPLNSFELKNIRSKSENDISSANDNGLPVAQPLSSYGSTSSSSTADSLSSAFKEYFQSRGNIPCEPIQDDDSFSSQPDDFESSNEYQKLESSTSSTSNVTVDIDQVLNKSQLSESLLYCLDGNTEKTLSPNKTRKRQLDESLEESSSTESLKRPLLDNNDFTDI